MMGLTELGREVLENYFGHSADGRSASDMVLQAGLIGCVRRASRYRRTHARHFERIGKSK